MKRAAWQAPLLPRGSMAVIGLARERVAWCEREGIAMLLCPEALLGGLADDAEHPAESAISVENGELEILLAPLGSDAVTTIIVGAGGGVLALASPLAQDMLVATSATMERPDA